MAGTGTVILTGDNSGFYGTTTVASGILDVASANAFPGTIPAGGVASGATLAVGVSGISPAAAAAIIDPLFTNGCFGPGANLGWTWARPTLNTITQSSILSRTPE